MAATRHARSALIPLAFAMGSTGHAQTQEPTAPEAVQEVVITGSNIATRALGDGPAPVTLISSEDIAASGARTLKQLVSMEPAFTGSSLGDGKGFFGENETGRTAGQARVNLRGIGEAYTLVLVNGRRFAGVDPANLNAIPLSAVERVEVLKDGASSVYGSDAVAGVVNVILRNRVDGLELSLGGGSTTEGGGTVREGDIAFGLGSQRASLVASASFYDRGEIRFNDRALARNRDQRALGGGLAVKTYTDPPKIFLPDSDGPVTLDQSRFGPGTYSLDPADFVPFSDELYAGSAGDLGDVGEASLINSAARAAFSLLGEIELNERATLYAHALYTDEDVFYNRDNWGVDFYGDANVDFGPIPATNPYNPFGIDLRDVFYALPEIGNHFYDVANRTSRLLAGLKGRLGGWRYDVGATSFRAENDFLLGNMLSNAGLREAINRPGADALNPFCNACNTAAQIAGVRSSGRVVSENQLRMFDAKLSGEVFDMPAGAASAAAGVEHRREALEQRPSRNILDGDLYFSTRAPIDLSRHVESVFAELRLPLFGEGFVRPGLHLLEVSLSARYETFSDGGNTTDPRVALRWQPAGDRFTLRASYGSAFRAPPLEALKADSVIEQVGLDNPDDGVDGPVPYRVLSGGNPDLGPETATYLNVGAVWKLPLFDDLTLSADAYELEQDDVVVLPDAQAVLDGVSQGEVLPTAPIPTIVATYFNAAGRRVRGADLGADYRHALGTGTLGVSLRGSSLADFLVDNDIGLGFVQAAGKFRGNGADGIESLPRFRLAATASWVVGPWLVGYELNHTGRYRDDPPTRDIEPYTTHDVTLSYELALGGEAGVRSTLQLGVENVLDEDPPFTLGEEFSPWDRSLFDGRGRFIYGRASFRF
jgi:iron complex outermembrane receptor protein